MLDNLLKKMRGVFSKKEITRKDRPVVIEIAAKKFEFLKLNAAERENILGIIQTAIFSKNKTINEMIFPRDVDLHYVETLKMRWLQELFVMLKTITENEAELDRKMQKEIDEQARKEKLKSIL